MYEIIIKTKFDAAHKLIGYKGKCRRLHGHTFHVEVSVSKEKLDKLGIAVDYKKLKQLTDKVLNKLDHDYLNQIKPFDKINPTSENLAKFIYDELEKLITKQLNLVTLNYVKVAEAEDSVCVYRRSS